MEEVLIRIGRTTDVPRLEGRRVTVGGHEVAVFHTDAGWRALAARCPHAGGPLADGIVAERCVTCPLHGWRFDLETGQALNAQARVEVYEVLERDGELWLALPAVDGADSDAQPALAHTA